MKTKKIKQFGTYTSIAAAIAVALFAPTTVIAQETDASGVEIIAVTGYRSSLKASMDDKKNANVVSDGIKAEDLGKFPDLNVAESLQRITGVSIDRNGGEGQAVTIRGFGPQFNTVLVNGRQMASETGGREFAFDSVSANQIVGADIFKTGTATMQEGGIGGTVSLITARPFDYSGFTAVVSAKGMYESLSEELSPTISALVSNTFNDDTMGILFSLSHEKRDVQINRIETAGWRPGQTISNSRDGVLYSNAYIPRNWDQIVDNQERTRTNANLVFQYAPSDDVTITLDGSVSTFEVDSQVTDLASWFEPDRVGSATIDEATGTLTSFSQDTDLFVSSGNPATDFVSHTRNSRDISNAAFGLNVDWEISDSLTAEFDVSSSTAENDRAGKDRFNVVGIINSYQFDGTGGTPTVIHDGFGNGSLPDANLARLHYNEKGNQPSFEDSITEVKADFHYRADGDVFTGANFGIYSQDREKKVFQIFASQCAFCGYAEPAPLDTLNFRPFTANNYFSGLIDTYYTYDGDAYVDYLAQTGNPITPTLQNNRYTVNEKITSVYADFNFETDIGDMPVFLNVGARYSKTSVDVNAVQSFIADVIPTTDQTLFSNVFGPATDIVESGSYATLLPSVNLKLQLQDDMILRFAVYDSLTRPTMSDLSPATNYGEPRRQNLTASGGNPALKPFRSSNWDISYEWYYADTSILTFAFFSKEVEDFITTLTGIETFTLANRSDQVDFTCADAACATLDITDETTAQELYGLQEDYTVSRPQNGESARVTGFELAWTHVFDNGFGVTANATVVDSSVEIGSDTSTTFALEGLGDSQNLVIFYEAEDWQARVAYNNREGFLRSIDNGSTGEPINTDTFGQIDISASYDISESTTVFFEGINITEEELVQTGRFANQTYSVEDNGSRYAIGIRTKF
ncbi:TonB-dependent receptor [Aliiglaciecola sp. 2_MG-2023]|uniref:TonB-dependent receptor n=1 Tax=unclassified Aliiglaciecola TaxID=2593648 RepID=UPI0026E26213|nr:MULTISPECIES: TonB-dependent receptor [unclassified Aliiglaciecola]MDO6710269.1 TonB-dependent receptor [Aliiglaciecola sp. 2_MG-2023]MDO6751417.1 TonB-dependent receptor [Aliiglaciecola sp. 1_MG-2023]